MDAVLRREDGKAWGSTKSAGLNANVAKPPLQPLNSQVFETTTEDRNDGLEFLNQPPPDLAGHDDSTFTVSKDINLMSPILIDILSDKAEVQKFPLAITFILVAVAVTGEARFSPQSHLCHKQLLGMSGDLDFGNLLVLVQKEASFYPISLVISYW